MPVPNDPSEALHSIAAYIGDMLGVPADAAQDTSGGRGARLRLYAPNATPGDERLLFLVIPLIAQSNGAGRYYWRIRGTVNRAIPVATLTAISAYITMWYASDGNP